MARLLEALGLTFLFVPKLKYIRRDVRFNEAADRFKNRAASAAWFLDIVGAEWVSGNVKNLCARKPASPLAWTLAGYSHSDTAMESLHCLIKHEPTKGLALIKRLLKADQATVSSEVNNAIVYRHLMGRGFSCEWEPIIIQKQDQTTQEKKPDLRVSLKNGGKIILEIRTVFRAEAHRIHEECFEELNEKLFQLGGPFCRLNLKLRDYTFLTKKQVEPLFQAFQEHLKCAQSGVKVSEQIEVDGEIIGKLCCEIKGIENVCFHHGPLHKREDAARIKGKIKEKLESSQLDPESPGGFLFMLDDFMMDSGDGVDAIQGQRAISFSRSGGDSELTRMANGVSSDPKLLDGVDFFIFFHSHDNTWEEKNFHFALAPDTRIDGKTLERMLY